MNNLRKAALSLVVALAATACAGESAPAVTPVQNRPVPQDPIEALNAQLVAPDDVPDPDAEQDLSERNLFAGVNIAISDVALGDVIFDTFDGGSVSLVEASESQVEGLRNAIPPINRPNYVPVRGNDWLSDDDLVLGYVADDGQAWAHPHRILNLHEIVNTTLAGKPVAITYCPLCGSGLVFDRRPNDLRQDGVLTFDNTSALYENDMVMVDVESNTYWWQVGGRGIVGNLTGAELTLLPSRTTSWGQWKELYPDSSVMSADQGFGRNYDRDPFSSYAARLDAGGRTPFPTSDAAFADERLKPATRVIGFDLDGQPGAVAVLANQPTVVPLPSDQVVFLDGRGGGQRFSTMVQGATTTFVVEAGEFFDAATGSTWDSAGRAIDGPARGAQLSRLPSRTAFWFAWISTLEGAPSELFAPEVTG